MTRAPGRLRARPCSKRHTPLRTHFGTGLSYIHVLCTSPASCTAWERVTRQGPWGWVGGDWEGPTLEAGEEL